jgi:hypothetical protein
LKINYSLRSYKQLNHSLLISMAYYSDKYLNDIIYLYHSTNIQYHEAEIFLSVPGVGLPQTI